MTLPQSGGCARPEVDPGSARPGVDLRTSDPSAAWLSALLADRLRGSSAPVLLVGDRTLPAASLWVGARRLVAQLREVGNQPGAALVVCTDDDLALAVTVVASLTGGYCLHVLNGEGSPADRAGCLGRHRDSGAVMLADRATAALVDGAVAVGIDGASGTIPAATTTAAAGLILDGEHLAAGDVAQLLAGHLARSFGASLLLDDRTSRPGGTVGSSQPWDRRDHLVGDLLVDLVAAECVTRPGPG